MPIGGSRLGEWRGRICKIISSSQLCHCVCSRAREASLAGLPSDTLRILVPVLSCSVVDPLWFQCGPGSSFYQNADPVLDPESQKSHKNKNLYMKNRGSSTHFWWKSGNQVYWLILVTLHAPGSGSAFPIRIRIQDSQICAVLLTSHMNILS